MAEAATAVQQGSAQMAEAVKAASAAVKAAIADQNAIFKQVGGQVAENSAAYGMYQEATQRVAAAQAELAAAMARAAAAGQTEAAAMGELAASHAAAATGANALGSAEAYASTRIAASAAGVGSLGYALGSVVRSSATLGPILRAAFPVLAAGAFADIIYQIASAFKKWYDNAILLKQLNQDLLAASESSANAAAAKNWEYVESVVALRRALGDESGAVRELQANIAAKPVKIEIGNLKDKDLQQTEQVLSGISKLVGQIRGSNTLGSADALVGPISAAADAANAKLAELQRNLAALQNAAAVAGPNPYSPARQDNSAAIASTQAQIQAVNQTAAALQSALGQIESSQGTAFNQIAAQTATGAKRSAREMVEAFDPATRQVERVPKQLAAVWAEVGRAARGAAAEVTAFDADQKRALESATAAYSKSNTAAIEQLKANEHLWERISAGARAAADQADRYNAGIGRMYEQQAESQIRQELADAKKQPQVVGLGDALEKSFSGVGNAFQSMMRGVLQGTQTLSLAWRRMGADMLASVVGGLVKIEVHNAAVEARRVAQHAVANAANVASDTSAAVASGTIASASAFQQARKFAGLAATKTYAAIAGIPIIGPFLAPEAAGAAYIGALAFASAAGGQWRVPGDGQMTMLHRDEMVLPAAHAEPLRRAVEGGQSGGAVQFHFAPTIHAMDAAGVDRVLAAHGDRFAKAMHRHLRARNAV